MGVDVEKIRSLPDAIRMAEHYLTPSECDITCRDPRQRDEVFLRCWTRKEAYLKGIGEGLAKPLNTFRIALDEQYGQDFIPVIDSAPHHSNWFVRSFTPCEGYAGAVAVNSDQAKVHQLPCVPAESLLYAEPTMCV